MKRWRYVLVTVAPHSFAHRHVPFLPDVPAVHYPPTVCAVVDIASFPRRNRASLPERRHQQSPRLEPAPLRLPRGGAEELYERAWIGMGVVEVGIDPQIRLRQLPLHAFSVSGSVPWASWIETTLGRAKP